MGDDAQPAAKTDFCTAYDINDPELARNWEQVVSELHQGCPVARSNVGEGYWVLNRYGDVSAAAQDWETFTSTSGFTPNRPEGQPKWYPVECDPPLHTAIREALDPYFRPKVITELEPEIHAHAHGLIDNFAEEGEVDVVAAFSNALPGWVVCGTMCGMPLEDLPWLHTTLSAGLTGPVEERGAKIVESFDYFERFLRARSEQPPRGDFVDAILGIELEGYGWPERNGTLSQVVTAGLLTTGHVMSSALYYLANSTAERDRIVADPALLSRGVEEFVRAFAPSPHNGRRATKDVEISGVEIAAGDFVLLGYGAASRDPSVCPHPEAIDIQRSPNRHVAFGAGVHRCIGAHLARVEIRIGLEAFLSRIPDYRIEPGFEPQYEQSIVRSMISLPLVF